MAFPEWVAHSPSGDARLAQLNAAAEQRRSLFADNDVVRLHDLGTDPLDGVQVERYGDYAVLSAYSAEAVSTRQELARALCSMGAKGVYYKERARTDLRKRSARELAPDLPLAGLAAPNELIVKEGRLRFSVRLADGLSTGLFLDQRDNRLRLLETAEGKRVLNLFAYCCSFSVAAGVGGALQVTSVDLSGAALARGDANLKLNGLPASQHRLLKADARKWLERACRREERYDFIVLDPPSFASLGSDTFSVERDYALLAEQCCSILAPGGTLLAVLNHRATLPEQHVDVVRAAAQSAGRTLQELGAPPPPKDCAQSGPSVTKSLLLRVS